MRSTFVRHAGIFNGRRHHDDTGKKVPWAHIWSLNPQRVNPNVNRVFQIRETQVPADQVFGKNRVPDSSGNLRCGQQRFRRTIGVQPKRRCPDDRKND